MVNVEFEILYKEIYSNILLFIYMWLDVVVIILLY